MSRPPRRDRRRRCAPARAGAVSVAELLLVFWMFALVLLALAGFLADQARLAAGQRDLVRLREAVRTTEVVLGSELRGLTAADVSPQSATSFRLRAVRGGGAVCSVGKDELGVRYRGVRRPEPRKDSVLVVWQGREEVRALSAVSEEACGGAGLGLRLEPPSERMGGLALVFESGSYHASEGAIRYRLGGAGRQPLTEAVFRSAAFAGAPGAAGVTVRLTVDRDSLPRAGGRVILSLASLNPEPGQ